MPNHSKKINLAKEQLEDAIELLLVKRYISALTLAGAAEEIFTALAHEKTGNNPFDSLHKLFNISLSEAGEQNISKANYRRLRNSAKNHAKHHDFGDSNSVQFNRLNQAYAKILQATLSADILEVKYKNKRKFSNWRKENDNT